MERFVSYGRRAFVILAVLALGAGVGAGSAWAAETFHGTVHISLDTSGADICDLTAGPIDESGLGNPDVTYTLSANATLGKACQNNGGNFPSDPKKNCGAGGVAGDATFAVKNGRVRNAFVTVDISQEVPVPLKCPGGQKPVVVSCTYTGITLTDSTNNVQASVDNSSQAFTLAGAPAAATACP